MAVIFGRTSTTTLNRGVQLVVTPDFKVQAPSSNDVTPNSVNWANIQYDGNTNAYIVAVQQITGINTSITLEVTATGIVNAILYVKVDNSSPTWSNGGSWDGDITGWTSLNNTQLPYTFTVTNNQYVSFGCDPDSPGVALRTITVKNNSDGAATLDTFTLNIIAAPE